MHRKQILFFDLDGTLTDSLPADRQALAEQMQKVQYYLTQDANGTHPKTAKELTP